MPSKGEVNSILCSQNLYGAVEFDRYGVRRTIKLDALANGMTMGNNGLLYLGDWSSIFVVDPSTGSVVDNVKGDGWDNIHTIRIFRDELLVASTGDDRAYLGKKVIFDPRKNIDAKSFTYLNSAIPLDDSRVVIGMRNLRLVVIYDVDHDKIDASVRLPFLNNMHHVTPYYDELFLVSDGDGVVLFDLNGRPYIKSPGMNWPRGIAVVDRRNVYVVDRNTLYLWNPVANRIERAWRSPLGIFKTMPVHNEQVVAGAFFDVIA